MNKPVTLCDHCHMRARCLLNYDGVLCRKNRSVEPTNADRIRAMSDEELADFFDSIVQDWHQGTAQIGNRIIDSWLDWLKEEA